MRPRNAARWIAYSIIFVLIAWLADWPFVHQGTRSLMHFITPAPLSLPYAPPPEPERWRTMTAAERLADARARLLPKLHDELAPHQIRLGQHAFIRIFKETRELELWLQADEGWKRFRTYPIACYSGTLGPKTKEGDMQAPEGFYGVTLQQLNPASSYHLSFNVGYPNAYDLAHQRTGSLIMVHGDTCSIGCFAMTDSLIEEIYLIVEAALQNASTVPIHIFPFRMTDDRMQSEQASPHIDFWQNLHPAHDIFDKDHRVPKITVENGRYQAR